jgi:hypothetical protein
MYNSPRWRGGHAGGRGHEVFKDCRFVLALGYALLMIPTAGFGASALGHALR